MTWILRVSVAYADAERSLSQRGPSFGRVMVEEEAETPLPVKQMVTPCRAIPFARTVRSLRFGPLPGPPKSLVGSVPTRCLQVPPRGPGMPEWEWCTSDVRPRTQFRAIERNEQHICDLLP